jgi:glycine/D-amino acid oxidase-like deaminating enzyme
MPATLSRRRFLETAGIGLALGVACRPDHRTSGWRPPFYRPTRHPAGVEVAQSRVIRVACGLRPFRPAGFVVRAEPLGTKLLVHNYGHGGAGVTLSWGTAELALELAPPTGTGSRSAVVGCGAVGLATAVLLQRRGAAVTIYARELPPAVTSNLAGAHFSPFGVCDHEARTPAFQRDLDRATRLSYRHFQNLVGPRYGVRWIDEYQLSHDPPDLTRDVPWAPGLTVLAPGSHPFNAPYVTRSSSLLIEPATYLATLLRDFQLAGGRVVVGELGGRAALAALLEPVIFNCSGLGAATLVGDEELLPVRGQLVVLVPQPEVDYLVLADRMRYMFPRSDGIVLGGTFERGVASLEPDPATTARILAGHQELFGGAAGPAESRALSRRPA